ncbi:uncharacterized protein LOC144148716 isoform X1 [Haemaphysalis longicornis]
MLKIVTFVIALQLFFDNCPFGVDCMPKSAERSLEGTNNTEDGEIFPLGNIGMHDDFTFAGCISAADDGEECVATRRQPSWRAIDGDTVGPGASEAAGKRSPCHVVRWR